MKVKAIILFLILALLACHKDAPEPGGIDASRIEGFWKLSIRPEWLYYFSNGYSQHRILTPGEPDYTLEYSYRTYSDTIFLSNIHTSQIRVWIVKYIDNDSAVIQEQTLDPIWPLYKLKRL